MTTKDLLLTAAHRSKLTSKHYAVRTLQRLLDRLPSDVLGDMLAHTIATDESGESESTSDLITQVIQQRWPTEAHAILDSAKARFERDCY